MKFDLNDNDNDGRINFSELYMMLLETLT